MITPGTVVQSPPTRIAFEPTSAETDGTQGALTSLLGTTKKLNTYLVGNPIIADRMFERNLAAGLYAPLRVSLFEDSGGTVHFVYDRPSSVRGAPAWLVGGPHPSGIQASLHDQPRKSEPRKSK